MVMDEPDAARGYDEAGEAAQVPLHDLNARAMSRLLPQNGTVVDLGCGSGRLLARLAQGRPDVRVLGLDLSDPMLALGRDLLEREGLSDRVELRKGDITTFDSEVTDPFDLVSCNYALHQLPDDGLVQSCLKAIARARERTGCAVYVFDLARLRNPRSWPDTLSMTVVPPVFRKDAIASERAAFTFDELKSQLQRAGLGDLDHAVSRPLGENQVHWADARAGMAAPGRFQDVPYPAGTRLLTRVVAAAFPRRLIRHP
jgi:ubiquinone/menaquinone biosynthesis C-methylase UbiE